MKLKNDICYDIIARGVEQIWQILRKLPMLRCLVWVQNAFKFVSILLSHSPQTDSERVKTKWKWKTFFLSTNANGKWLVIVLDVNLFVLWISASSSRKQICFSFQSSHIYKSENLFLELNSPKKCHTSAINFWMIC